MAAKNGNGFYKTVSTHLATVIIAVLGAWFSFGGGVDRSEAESIAQHAASDAIKSPDLDQRISKKIATESLYAKDKSAIEVRLKHIEDMVIRIDRKLDQ